ncbi:MAG: hypothetical protein HYY17_15005 [Planctomycetes bacterium]|nr:hypothetical protein [Planctomycetota bacterium]
MAPDEKPVEPPKRIEDFRYDAWDSWNSFAPGASVEFEMEAGGSKMRQVKTLDSKRPDAITVKSVMILKIGDDENRTESDETFLKSRGGPAQCPSCKKPVSSHDPGTFSRERLKIGDRDLDCVVWKSPARDCSGKATTPVRMWYCKDVPGGNVKTESEHWKMTATRFDPKK